MNMKILKLYLWFNKINKTIKRSYLYKINIIYYFGILSKLGCQINFYLFPELMVVNIVIQQQNSIW